MGSPRRAFSLGHSRLETEFEHLEELGSGGFGDVMKVGGEERRGRGVENKEERGKGGGGRGGE